MAYQEARNSLYVKDELKLAQRYTKTVIPFWIDGEHWEDCIPLGLGMTQGIDARGGNFYGGLEQLKNRLNASI